MELPLDSERSPSKLSTYEKNDSLSYLSRIDHGGSDTSVLWEFVVVDVKLVVDGKFVVVVDVEIVGMDLACFLDSWMAVSMLFFSSKCVVTLTFLKDIKRQNNI